MRIRVIVPALFVLALAAAASADSILFKDGRYYEVPRLVKSGERYEAHFRNGTVQVPAKLVQDVFIEQTGDSGEPPNEEDAAKIAKGLVSFEGKWIPKSRRDDLLARRNEEARQRLAEYLAHQNWRDRYVEETRHFQFEFTVPLEVGQENMEMFEVFFDTFAKVFKLKQPRGKKLKVCFYNNEEDFLRIGNVPKGVLGYFRFVEPLELNFFLVRQDKRLTLDVLFHELNHYMFHLYTEGSAMLPHWLNEGMSEYYGASVWDAQTKKMSVGHLQEGRLVHLIDEMDGGNMQDLRSLMAEVRIDATQYAWSWTLCHMMMEDKKYRPRFEKYIEMLARDSRISREPYPGNMSFTWVPPAKAIEVFQKVMGIDDLDAFQQEWYDYIRSLDVKTARGYHRAGMFCLRWDRPVRAGMYFKKAIEEYYSDNPQTYQEYGELLVREDKANDAIPVLLKGLELDPMNPSLWIALGDAYRQLGGDENKEKGKRHQLLAIEMDPLDTSLLFGLDPDVLEALGQSN